MSRTIWGNPLTARVPSDEANRNKLLADLRNWEQLYVGNEQIDIEYDPSSRTNSFTFTMVTQQNETLVYEFPVKPNTNYMFDARIYGEFTTANGDPQNPFGSAIAVFSKMPINKPIEQQEDAVITSQFLTSGRRQNYIQRFNSGDLTSVFLAIHMGGCTDEEAATFSIDNIVCRGAALLGDPIWAQKPRWINGYDEDDSINMMAVSSEGAWAYSCIDKSKTHHLYFLAGNEFKVLVFKTDNNIGLISKKEIHSSPITVQGRTYYACHEYWPSVSWDDIWTTEYVEDEPSDDTIAKRLSDDEIYLKLSRWVREEEPYDIGDLYSKDMLKSYLQLDNSAIDDMFKDYTVDEHGLNYLNGE